jgi:hypothetical protein
MNEGTQGRPSTDLSTASSEGPRRFSLFIGPHGLRPFWCLLIYLAILTPVALLLVHSHTEQPAQTAPHETHYEISSFTTALVEWMQFGFIFFVTWIMSCIEGRDVFDYGLQPTRRLLRWLTTGAVCGLLFMSLLIAILSSTRHLIFTGILLHPASALGYGLIWAAAYLGVGFFEEFFFRGYLQFTLARCVAGFIRWLAPATTYADSAGFWMAAVLISFGFGLGHGANPGESPIGLLCAGLAGLMFAFTLWRTGSLWFAIGLHAAWDWAQSFLYGVADSGAVSHGRLLGSHPAGSVLMSGGLTGPEGSLFVLPVMLLITAAIVLTLPRRSASREAPWAATGSSSASGGTLA